MRPFMVGWPPAYGAGSWRERGAGTRRGAVLGQGEGHAPLARVSSDQFAGCSVGKVPPLRFPFGKLRTLAQNAVGMTDPLAVQYRVWGLDLGPVV
jgi:hypothetical protein